MKKPWIGIPTRYHEKSEYIGQIRHYLDAVLWAGGLPLLIPHDGRSRHHCANMSSACRGCCCREVQPTSIPVQYGAAPHAKLGKLVSGARSNRLRDSRSAEAKDMPVLGICFGVQSLNVHRGGSLVQDIPSVVSSPLVHDEDDGKPPARHMVRLTEDSLDRAARRPIGDGGQQLSPPVGASGRDGICAWLRFRPMV